MSEPNIKASRTLGFKLLLGATAIVIAILASAIGITFPLLTEDTKSYTFELQASQAQLVGEEFSSLAESAIENFRLALSIVPRAKDWKLTDSLNADKKGRLDSLFLNQDSVKNLEILYFPAPDQNAKSIYSWPASMASSPPSRDQIFQLVQKGASYSATVSGTDMHLSLYFIEKPTSVDPPPPLIVIRGELNTTGLVRKSRGTLSEVVDLAGTVLFDSRKPETVGSTVSKDNPLLSTALSSIVGVGTLEFQDPQTKESNLGAYVIPGFNVIVLSAIRKVDAFRGTYLLLERLVLAGLLLLGTALIIVVFFSIGISRPLANLTEATHQIAGGNFSLQLDERSNDEIGILSKSMNIMSKKIQELLLDSIEKVKIEQEVAIAATLQQNLIPAAEIVTDRFSMFSHYQSAAECGGDWWGYVESRDYISVIIADATGHGLPAAMLTASARGCFSAMQKLLLDFPEVPSNPGFLLTYANRAILESTNSELNMTMFIASYHFESRYLTYASAGHNPSWLILPNEKGIDFKLLKSRGSRLGETLEYEEPKSTSIELKPGQKVFLYTDGLIEDKNRHDEEYGKERVKEILNAHAAEGGAGMASALRADIETFYEGVTPDDDITFVLLEPKI